MDGAISAKPMFASLFSAPERRQGMLTYLGEQYIISIIIVAGRLSAFSSTSRTLSPIESRVEHRSTFETYSQSSSSAEITNDSKRPPAGAMHIVVCGHRSFIGNAILLHALKTPFIEHIYAISRFEAQPAGSTTGPQPPPPSVSRPHSKVTEILLTPEEFTSWPEELLDQLAKVNVRACIWCIGGPPAKFADTTAAEIANIELPLAAASALAKAIGPKIERNAAESILQNAMAGRRPVKDLHKPFRFIYLSISGAERNPAASLWVQAQYRKMKGAAEAALFDQQAFFSQDYPGVFEVYSLRLGKVLMGGKTAQNIITEGIQTSINVERVAKVCCDVAYGGWWEDDGDKRRGGILENAEILGSDWAEVPKTTRF